MMTGESYVQERSSLLGVPNALASALCAFNTSSKLGKIASPKLLSETLLVVRAKIGEPSSNSSCRMLPDSVGWVTLQALAARVKCFSLAKAARYSS